MDEVNMRDNISVLEANEISTSFSCTDKSEYPRNPSSDGKSVKSSIGESMTGDLDEISEEVNGCCKILSDYLLEKFYRCTSCWTDSFGP